MKTKSIVKNTFLAFCILGMLVLPAAAAPMEHGTKGNPATIDQGLKDDLWNNHQQYRLQAFDMHVQRATSVIGILNKYSIDTGAMQRTLTSISGKRPALENALANRDKEGLIAINTELGELWKQFRTQMRESIRSHFGVSGVGRTAGVAGIGQAIAAV